MTTASDAEPCASNRCPRWSNGSAEVIRTELAFVATASPSAPCDSADDAVAESETSTMYEMPSPSAMAWLSLLTRRDRSRPRANRASQLSSYPGHAPRVARPRRPARGRRRRRGARRHRDGGKRPPTGTPRADVLRGLAGGDVLVAGPGRDFLDGGPGRDTHDAGAGADLIATSYDGARDVVRCGAGVDVVNADLPDTVTRDCELVGRRLSRDPYTTADAQHETEVEPDSFTFGRTTVATFQVGRRFDGAATNAGWAVTTNDGAHVAERAPARAHDGEPARRAGTPEPAIRSLRTTPHMRPGSSRRSRSKARQPASRSTGRRTAPPGALRSPHVEERADEGIAFDKNWLACDNTPSSPFYGRCYLVYTHSTDRDMLAVSWSTDGGLTWSAPVDIGARPGVGVFPAIRPTGEIVVVYLLQGDGQFAIAVVADRRTEARRGARPSVSPRSTAVAGFETFARSRCRARRWIARPRVGDAGTTASRPVRPRTPCSSRRRPTAAVDRTDRSHARAERRAAGDRDRSGDGAGRDRVHASERALQSTWSSSNRPGPPAGLPARRLSSQSMELAWMPNTTSGRMLGDYISVHYAGGRPLVVWVLATPPVGPRFRQAIYATRG